MYVSGIDKWGKEVICLIVRVCGVSVAVLSKRGMNEALAMYIYSFKLEKVTNDCCRTHAS